MRRPCVGPARKTAQATGTSRASLYENKWGYLREPPFFLTQFSLSNYAYVMPKVNNPLQHLVLKLTFIHFIYVLCYFLMILAYKAWALYTPQALNTRWAAAILMTAAVGLVGYYATHHRPSPKYYHKLIQVLVMTDLALATFGVYVGRGMASRSVALFFVPIVVSSFLGKSKSIFATAISCGLAYSAAAIAYFAVHPSEGYKVELYSDLVFYSASFLVVAGLLLLLIKTKHK